MSENQGNSNQQFVNPYQAYPYYYPQTSQAYYPENNARQQQAQQSPGVGGMLPIQQSYIENILRLNKGKEATVFMTFEGNNAKTFKGVIEAAGRDHIIISDLASGKRYLLLMVYLDYITFDEEINYTYPFDSTNPGVLSNHPPR